MQMLKVYVFILPLFLGNDFYLSLYILLSCWLGRIYTIVEFFLISVLICEVNQITQKWSESNKPNVKWTGSD